MQPWERALHKFLAPWRARRDVVGALACGSRVHGTATKRSDVDVHIILQDGVRWRERGNKLVDGYLIEYFANPAWQHRKYEAEDARDNTRINARMFAYGLVIFDKHGDVRRLQRDGRRAMRALFKRPGRAEREAAKYHLWDHLDTLEDLAERRSASFWHAFHVALDAAYRAYGKARGAEVLGAHRRLEGLESAEFRRKYGVAPHPDPEFARLFRRGVRSTAVPAALRAYRGLAAHIHRRMGGFRIDGWKLRGAVKRG